jgi:hypothetical protein
MGMVTWRRHHGRDLVATVVVRRPHAHTIAVWNEATGVVREPRNVFRRLESAKAAADAHLRDSFDHVCSLDSCGKWMIWTG